MKKIELIDGIYWIGAVDWNLRDFHGYTTPRGGTYNAYLIIDEKIAPHAEVICPEKGKEGLSKYYGGNWNFRTVKTGDELKLGKRTLFFITAPMLHWPDSMATYIKEDRLLFSNDLFGQHLASSFRFDEGASNPPGYESDVVMEEAAKYYAIFMQFGALILKKIEEMRKLGITPKMIAPSHGIIWKNPGKIVNAYINWAKGISKEKALIIYDTMWNSTEIMAKEIQRGVSDSGVEASIFHLRRNEWSEIVKEVLESRAVLIGSPTLHNDLFPTVGGFLTYLMGLRPNNKIWAPLDHSAGQAVLCGQSMKN